MATVRKPVIVLAHGIARFDVLLDALTRKLAMYSFDLNAFFGRWRYFKGIAGHLRKHGFEVYETRVGFAEGVAARARDLAGEIQKVLRETGRSQVHIVAHSMGGLDARHMIVDEQMAPYVTSLTTIGTPHLGTSFADWGLAHGGDQVVEGMHSVLDLSGFRDLTTAACNAFNAEAESREAANNVVYRTYAGSQACANVFFPLQPACQIIQEREGDNDGLVSVKSQRWKQVLEGSDGTTKRVEQHEFPVPADHLNELGWWDLNEIGTAGWKVLWHRGEVKRYEQAIRNVYLKIANQAAGLEDAMTG
jgi:triacylglycerol lipase